MTRWAPYATASEVEHFGWFCREHLEQSVDVFAGQPLELEAWQVELMGEALALDENGESFWRSVAIVLPRKCGKTTLLAAVALYRVMYDLGAPEILLAAASDRQAGRLFDSVAAFVRRSPFLLDRLTIRAYAGEIARTDGEGRILRMSSSPERLHGYNPSLVICDEVAQWTTPSLRRAWAALTTAGGARSAAQTFTISTAGAAHERHDSILGRLIDGNEERGDVERVGALTISRNEPARTLLYNFSARTTDPRDVAAIKAANPASWVAVGFLERQANNPELLASEFLQLHGCVWSVAEDEWLVAEAWEQCARPGRVVEAGERICLGFDGSLLDDATAIVACCLADGHVFVLDVWQRPEGAAGDGWQVPRNLVEVAVAGAFGRFEVVRMYADPPHFQAELDRWREQWGDTVVSWWTARERQMAFALERLSTAVLSGQVTHDGDRRLAQHVANAHRRESRAGTLITKDRPGSPRKIDAAIAATLAFEARADAVAAGALKPRNRRRAVFI